MVRYNLLGIPVDSITIEEVKKFIINSVEKGNKNYIVTLNPEMLTIALRDKEYFQILKYSALNTIDGFGIKVALKLLYNANCIRVPGINIFFEILKESTKNNIKIFLLGSTDNTIMKCKERLNKLEMQKNIVGLHNGYFTNDNEIIEIINSSFADVLFVGMGVPKQEKWLYTNWNKLNIKIAIGIGGALDVFSGKVKRAPGIFCKVGLEWLWRTMKEPKRIKRLTFLPLFIYYIIKEYLKQKFK